LKDKRDEEEMRKRRKDLEMRERVQSMRERKLESRQNRSQDLVFILRQKLKLQQASLERIQQQDKFLLALYQTSLETKDWCCFAKIVFWLL